MGSERYADQYEAEGALRRVAANTPRTALEAAAVSQKMAEQAQRDQPVAPGLPMIEKRIFGNAEGLVEINIRLGQLTDRLIGPQPEAGGNLTSGPDLPDGFISRASVGLDTAEARQRSIFDKLDQLDHLI